MLSGGLDSILAVKVLQEQEVDLIAIIFKTPFFGPKPGVDLTGILGAPIRVIDISEAHLEMLKKPVYGYGSHMNPCIDCHALMLREAGRLMEEENADFLFTGEVLGQRPMSQRRDSLKSVENLSGYPGRVLRPLSAKLLPPTIVEQEGLIDRSKLLDISGRSRKKQMELVKRYGMVDYPQPGGGCMLTKEGFVRKLREMLLCYPQAGPREMELLKWGRHFRLPEGSICIVGRHASDNEKLEALATEQDLLLRVMDHPSPTCLIVGPISSEQDQSLAGRLAVAYSDAPMDGLHRVEWRKGGSVTISMEQNTGKDFFSGYLL